MLQRHRVAVERADGHGLPTPGYGARERDGPGGGSRDVSAHIARDVDAAVLSGGVGIVSEPERTQHLPLGRP
jgi:hypothetical protein